MNHPNILAVHDVGEQDGQPFIVTELLEGKSLRGWTGSGEVTVRRAVQVARGLSASHERGMVHRDLKPENLFVTSDGTVRILDFGLAKLAERGPGEGADAAETASLVTGAGRVMGTLQYMSPEQARGQSADARSDVFSFGTVLYELLSDRRPFRGEWEAELVAAILQEDPRSLRELAPGVPAGLQNIVRRCLEKRPDDRYRTSSTPKRETAAECGASPPAAGAW